MKLKYLKRVIFIALFVVGLVTVYKGPEWGYNEAYRALARAGTMDTAKYEKLQDIGREKFVNVGFILCFFGGAGTIVDLYVKKEKEE